MSIRDLPSDQRPREKLLTQGPSSLSDAELLAIFLRTGVVGKNAIELAQHLIDTFGGLPALLNANQHDFCQHQGLGKAKFAQLQAVLEMARRHWQAQLRQGELLTNVEAVVALLTERMADEPCEILYALFLDNKHRLLAMEELARGSLREAPLYPREIVRRAFNHNAAALILAHNHPSGDPTPSYADQQATRKLAETLLPLDIRLLDHLIIGKGLRYTSLAAAGLM